MSLLAAVPNASATSGRRDHAFGTNGIGGGTVEPHLAETGFSEVAEEADGDLIAVRSGRLRRYSTDGVLDRSFAPRKQNLVAQPTSAAQPDGKTLVAVAEGVERLDPDGSLDHSFGKEGVSESLGMTVGAIAVLPSSKILVAGTTEFRFIAKLSEYQLAVARLDPDGSLDPSFGVGGLVRLRSDDGFEGTGLLGIEPPADEGAVLITQGAVLKLGPEGKLDPSYGTDGVVDLGVARLLGFRVTSGERLTVAGISNREFFLARLTPDGRPDPAFASGAGTATVGEGGIAEASTLLWAADGSVTIGGEVTAAEPCPTGGCEGEPALARFDASGSPEAGFGADGLLTFPGLRGRPQYPAGVVDLLQRPGGEVIAAGGAGPEGSVAFLAAVNPDGSLESGFGTEGILEEREPVPSRQTGTPALAIGPRGRILVAASNDAGPGEGMAVFRYGADGRLDRNFGGGKGFLYTGDSSRAVQLVLGGSGAGALLEGKPGAVSRFTAAGLPDPHFGEGGRVELPTRRAHFRAIALLPDGKLLVAGTTDWLAEHARMLVLRLLPDGRPDPSFGRDGRATVGCAHRGSCMANRIMVEPDGAILLAGRVLGRSPGGRRYRERPSRIAVARLLPDGHPDRSFAGHGLTALRAGFRSEATAMAQAGAGIVIACRLRGNDREDVLVRLDPDGHLDRDFATDGISHAFPPGSGAPTAILPTRRQIIVATQASGSRPVLIGFDSAGALDRSYPMVPAAQLMPSLVSGPSAALQAGRTVLAWTQGPAGGGPIALRLTGVER